jgi:hypothetical protein
MSIREALLLKNHSVEIQGTTFTFRRPSAADLIAAVEESKNPNFSAWLVKNHLLDEEGKPFFSNVNEVLESDGMTIFILASEIDKLYGEGGN